MLASIALKPVNIWIALATGALAAGSNLLWGPEDSRIAGTILALTLSWAAIVDLERMMLPDLLVLPLLPIGLAQAAGHGLDVFAAHAGAALAGYFALAGLAAAYRRLRKQDGLGLGDAKLFAAAGAWLGFEALPFVMLIAAAVALLVIVVLAAGRRSFDPYRPFPFGPYLAAGLWISWIAPMTERGPFVF